MPKQTLTANTVLNKDSRRQIPIRILPCLLPLLAVLLLQSCSYSIPEALEVAYSELPEEVDFNFHVKPILSDRCFSCHGPDENARKAGLRLDMEASAFAALASGSHALVKGKPGQSESVNRMLSEDPELVMPPPESNLALSSREKAMIIKWIEQGAQWKNHWAFEKVAEVEAPEVIDPSWPVHNNIDLFVQNNLAAAGFEPSPKASKERLIRRVSMDLTGLPPTLEEIDAYLADDSPNAYEKVVDRLLASPAHAEQLTLNWLDLSRYADSHGFHADGSRTMWPWRDWVIEAFRNNMPYDQFVSWQLAGDLLPDATKEQRLATAFNRNHPMTAEGGVIDEEFRLNYVYDRTETVGTAFMGLTVACARCHDHKFDPISQEEYYEMTGFFNNIKELGMTGDDGDYGPMLALPDPETEVKLAVFQDSIARLEKELALTEKELRDLDAYIKTLPENASTKKLVGHYPFNTIQKRRDNYWVDGNPDLVCSKAPAVVEGKADHALEFSGEYDEIHVLNSPNFELYEEFSAALWMYTTKRKAGKTQTLLGTAGDKNNFWRGWDFYLDSLNHLNVRLIHSLPHNYIHLRSRDSLKTRKWYHVAFTYDGSAKSKGLGLFVDGKPVESETQFDQLYKSIKTIRVATHELYDQPIRIAKSYRNYTGDNGIFLGKMDEVYLYSRQLAPEEIRKLRGTSGSGDSGNPATEYHIAQDPTVTAKKKALATLREEWLDQMMQVDEIMVMEDMPEKRPTFLYDRGDYESPLREVQSNTPDILPPFPSDTPKSRLGLAEWLFSGDHPLTARVAVNRYWHMLFGRGLVMTPEDFGVQGALPTHPELLDWMAHDFVDSGWDLRRLLKTMVMSHTYRQSSIASERMKIEDPLNSLLARSNTYRLPAEMIRDNALAASGLLVRTTGGESVKPYQPPNLWIEKSSFSYDLLRYRVSKGDSLYRRSMYTFIRRTQPHPAMTVFDAPSREVCTVRRENTNTPLQALVLLNDVQFQEASRALAQRVMRVEGETKEAQITQAFRLATSRRPDKKEVDILTELFQNQKGRFDKDPEAVRQFLSIGESPVRKEVDQAELAAMTMVANTILNHDETYTKR